MSRFLLRGASLTIFWPQSGQENVWEARSRPRSSARGRPARNCRGRVWAGRCPSPQARPAQRHRRLSLCRPPLPRRSKVISEKVEVVAGAFFLAIDLRRDVPGRKDFELLLLPLFAPVPSQPATSRLTVGSRDGANDSAATWGWSPTVVDRVREGQTGGCQSPNYTDYAKRHLSGWSRKRPKKNAPSNNQKTEPFNHDQQVRNAR